MAGPSFKPKSSTGPPSPCPSHCPEGLCVLICEIGMTLGCSLRTNEMGMWGRQCGLHDSGYSWTAPLCNTTGQTRFRGKPAGTLAGCGESWPEVPVSIITSWLSLWQANTAHPQSPAHTWEGNRNCCILGPAVSSLQRPPRGLGPVVSCSAC